MASALAGCAGSPSTPDAADRTFLQDMLPHHNQAIAAAVIAETRGCSSQVLAFARRIVAEQSPEVVRMRAASEAAHLQLNVALGDQMAVDRISNGELAQLRHTPCPGFDETFLDDSIRSEMGAVVMAKTELAAGHDPTVRAIAGPISTAENPGSEISQLRHLRKQLESQRDHR